MTALETLLRHISTELEDVRVGFALVGGLAVSARSEPRFTRDADIAVAVANDAEAERLVRILQGRRYSVVTLVEQDAVGRLATVRLARASESAVLDLLFASSGIEPEVVAAAESIELLRDLRVRVATTAHLIALKVLSRDDLARPQDLVDLRALLRVASASDLERASAAVALISERGYHRGRDLHREFESLLRPT